MQSLKCLPQVPSPILLFLPPDPHGPPHFVRSLLLRPQNAIFLPSKNLLVFCSHFFTQKCEKSSILASQNVPQTLPKCFRNRTPQKHAFLNRFWLDFCCLLQEPNLKIHAPTQCFVDVAPKTHLGFSHAFWIRKTYPKPFKNDVRTL